MQEYLLAGAIQSEGRIGNPVFKGTILESYSQVLESGSFFNAFLPRMVGLLFIIGSVIFLFMLIVGSISWIASGGDKQALESARSRISNALVGIILLFVSYAIIQLIEFFFGIDILTIDIGPLIIQ